MNDQIYSRRYTAIHPLSTELQYLPGTNYLFDLDYLNVILMQGEKASECLQGQLSCDMRAVTEHYMQQGLMCNLKGRIMAILDVVMMSNQSIALVLPADLCMDTQRSLEKPAAFSRVQLHHSALKIYGLFVQNEADLRPLDLPLPAERYDVVNQEAVCCYQIDPSFYLYIVQPEMVDVLTQPFLKQNQCRGSLAWHALQLQHHRVEIYPESRGMFLPHRLDMHLSGHISFEKGCYKGQEIIARMHYRSTQKHRLLSLMIESEEEPKVGSPLYAEDVLCHNHGVKHADDVPRDVRFFILPGNCDRLPEDHATIVGEVIDCCMVNTHQYLISASVLISYSCIPHHVNHSK